jgi:hypothetical protein
VSNRASDAEGTDSRQTFECSLNKRGLFREGRNEGKMAKHGRVCLFTNLINSEGQVTSYCR